MENSAQIVGTPDLEHCWSGAPLDLYQIAIAGDRSDMVRWAVFGLVSRQAWHVSATTNPTIGN